MTAVGGSPARRAVWSGAMAFVMALGALIPAAGAQEAGTSAATTEAPVISVPTGPQAIGFGLQITGTGWAPFTTLSAAVCGNNGVRGSADCTSLGRSFFSQSDGGVVFEDVLGRPPSPCPCIVRVREIEGPGEAKIPIEIEGMPAPVTSSAALPAAELGPAQLVVNEMSVGGGGWTSYFGLPSTRTLEVVVTNPSSIPVTTAVFAAAWGCGPDGSHLIEVPSAGEIGPGETVTLSADFSTGPALLRRLRGERRRGASVGPGSVRLLLQELPVGVARPDCRRHRSGGGLVAPTSP